MKDDSVSNLLDSDFDGYELRTLLNVKNPYYDNMSLTKRERIRKPARKNNKKRK